MSLGEARLRMMAAERQCDRNREEAANLFEIWTKDRESLARWRAAFLFLALLDVAALVGWSWAAANGI